MPNFDLWHSCRNWMKCMWRFLYLTRADLRTEPQTGITYKILIFVKNVWIQPKMWLQTSTTLKLVKCRIFFENYMTNNDKFFQLMPFHYVVAVRQTTGHHTAWRLYCVLVLLLEEQRRYSLESPIKWLPVVPTELDKHTGYRVRLKLNNRHSRKSSN